MTNNKDEVEGKSVDDFDKDDLIQLFVCLQGELEAKDIALDALRAEHIKTANLKAKYGIVANDRHRIKDLDDPFQALQRDSSCIPSCDNESALKPLYDSQLLQLENLISSQRYAQNKMRDQLILMEKRYVKACEELEEERRKHERDAAQGDDVLVMLEKERERLKSEVEYEKSQNRKLTRDLRRVILSWRDQNVLCNKQKFAAVTLIKERKRLFNELVSERKRVAELELTLQQSVLNKKSLGPDCNSTDNKIIGHAVDPNNDVCCNYQCELLRQKLAEETENRKAIECCFERLKADYQKLICESYLKDAVVSRPPDDSLGVNVSLVNGGWLSFENHSSPESVASASLPLKLKPNPPQRRSSDMTTHVSPTCNLISAGSILISNNSNHSGNTTSGGFPATVEPCFSSSKSPGNASEKSNSQLSVVPPTTSPPSRSSTPSPPPPPPPMQLHYPYPGMQGHLNHASKSHSGPPPFLPSTSSNRLISNSMSHTAVVQTCKSRNLISYQPSAPYQPSYSSPNHTVVISGRAANNSIHSSRGATRKPMSVNVQHTNFHHHNPHSSPRPVSSFIQPQSKPPSVALQFSQHSGLVSITTPHPPVGGHHFPTHSSHRSHSSVTNPATSNARPRNPIQNNQSGLSVAVSVMGAGHVCVNGK
ncbi:hypothetical protein MN116_006909 [Schistosoma mekongi]|uniref:Cortactin-binding protein-2 N-terminal domain-containing protein n=1 Tax=Schistosoma mekongi TaxID=38744 RepID=A0AAE1Z908_SCHME|nr:hypothetical protein MN116_006909 [Schistosoma mekongi]